MHAPTHMGMVLARGARACTHLGKVVEHRGAVVGGELGMEEAQSLALDVQHRLLVCLLRLEQRVREDELLPARPVSERLPRAHAMGA